MENKALARRTLPSAERPEHLLSWNPAR